jgi:hypothetical protein
MKPDTDILIPEPAALTRRRFLQMALLALPAFVIPGTAHGATARAYGRPLDLGFISARLPLVRRSAWTRYQPRLSRIYAASRFSRLTIHHTGLYVNTSTARNSVARDMQGVLAAHVRLRYGDIGYHFAVDYSGCVWEGRSLAHQGAHVSGANEHNIGVVLLGNFERQRPAQAQMSALRSLVSALTQRYGISSRRIYGHRDLGATACPGRYLYPGVTNLRRSYSA